jgi:hypothetical protein
VSTFAAIREPAYRRLLFAMTVSETGLYAFETALFWTAFVRSGSTLEVGLLYAGLIVPVLASCRPGPSVIRSSRDSSRKPRRA